MKSKRKKFTFGERTFFFLVFYLFADVIRKAVVKFSSFPPVVKNIHSAPNNMDDKTNFFDIDWKIIRRVVKSLPCANFVPLDVDNFIKTSFEEPYPSFCKDTFKETFGMDIRQYQMLTLMAEGSRLSEAQKILKAAKSVQNIVNDLGESCFSGKQERAEDGEEEEEEDEEDSDEDSLSSDEMLQDCPNHDDFPQSEAEEKSTDDKTPGNQHNNLKRKQVEELLFEGDPTEDNKKNGRKRLKKRVLPQRCSRPTSFRPNTLKRTHIPVDMEKLKDIWNDFCKNSDRFEQETDEVPPAYRFCVDMKNMYTRLDEYQKAGNLSRKNIRDILDDASERARARGPWELFVHLILEGLGRDYDFGGEEWEETEGYLVRIYLGEISHTIETLPTSNVTPLT